MDRKTATIITNLEEQGFKNEARRILNASLKKTAATMPRFCSHQGVSLVYHGSDQAISGVVTDVGKGRVTTSSPAGHNDYVWTGQIFEDIDDSKPLATLVAILPKYGE